MVKFQVRWMKKRYLKKKEYRYKHYSLYFPARLNEKIEPHMSKDFQIEDFTAKETAKKEITNIPLSRDKLPSKVSTRSQSSYSLFFGKLPTAIEILNGSLGFHPKKCNGKNVST